MIILTNKLVKSIVMMEAVEIELKIVHSYMVVLILKILIDVEVDFVLAIRNNVSHFLGLLLKMIILLILYLHHVLKQDHKIKNIIDVKMEFADLFY